MADPAPVIAAGVTPAPSPEAKRGLAPQGSRSALLVSAGIGLLVAAGSPSRRGRVPGRGLVSVSAGRFGPFLSPLGIRRLDRVVFDPSVSRMVVGGRPVRRLVRGRVVARDDICGGSSRRIALLFGVLAGQQ